MHERKPEKFLRLLFVGFGGLAFATVVGYLFDGYFAGESRALTGFLALLILLFMLILFGIYVLLTRTDPSPRFEYYTYDDDDERDKMHKRVTDIIRKAKKSIKVINAWREEEPPGSQFPYREDYFNALIKRADEGIPYIRLVQGDRPIAEEFDHTYKLHFRQMLELRAKTREPRPKITLFSIPPIVPATFVIVDNEYLLWQLNEVAPKRNDRGRKQFWMRAVVIVNGGEFVDKFKETFDKALLGDKEEIRVSDLKLT